MSNIHNILTPCHPHTGPPIEILQGGTRLFWDPGDRLRLLSKLRIWGSIKPIYDQQPEFQSLSEFSIINIKNKLKIVENTNKKERKSK